MERKQIIQNFASPSVAYRGKPFWSPIVDPEIFAKVRANVSCTKSESIVMRWSTYSVKK